MPGAQLRLHDTLSRQAQPVPISGTQAEPQVRLYVCGITPYDSGHLGHAFTYAAFDVLVRYLEAEGVAVRYVQNVTDVDTPLFERARRDGVDWSELARQEEASFIADMDRLGWRRPDVMPRASEEIAGIQDAVVRLDRGGHIYSTDATYFAAGTYAGFGQLSKLSREEMLAKLADEELLGRQGPDAKRDLLDFAVWTPSAPGEPAWRSPYRAGRPGWHIECSVMAMRYLGETIDIHGGGRDLVFSHHESERAQSESLTGRPFARHWMHTGMVRVGGHKMSKSRGNLVMIKAALERVSPAALRLYLASHPYRDDWDFDWDELAAMEPLAAQAGKYPRDGARLAESGLGREFLAALDDDLDTPRAVDVLRRAVDQGEAAPAGVMLGLLAGGAASGVPASRG